MKNNDKNLHGKRTATQVKSILKSNGIFCKVENFGDGRTFYLGLKSTMIARMELYKIGFILCVGKESDNHILVKAY